MRLDYALPYMAREKMASISDNSLGDMARARWVSHSRRAFSAGLAAVRLMSDFRNFKGSPRYVGGASARGLNPKGNHTSVSESEDWGGLRFSDLDHAFHAMLVTPLPRKKPP